MSMSLCVTVWNWDYLEQHELIGGVILPLCSYELATVEKKWYNLREDVVKQYNNYTIYSINYIKSLTGEQIGF